MTTVADVQAWVADFHRRFGLPVGVCDYSESQMDLRVDLIEEEVREAVEELGELGVSDTPRNLPRVAKELADAVYVLYGAAVELGIDLTRAVLEVHRSNMSKLGEDGLPVLREDGKVLKGPNYREADVTAALPPWYEKRD